MRITIDLERTLEENAAHYFEKAKKARSKMEGAQEAVERTRALLAERTQEAERAKEQAALEPPKQHWYHKYRWSRTRNGHLLVGGQNASANEVIIKHHAEGGDTVFHTDMAGSPFVVLKPEEGREVTAEDLEDGAVFTGCYSKAWGKGMSTVEVFHVAPDQVTKEAQAGEFLPKGAFMIRGDTTYHHPQLELGVGVVERDGVRPEVFAGSPAACEAHCAFWKTIIPGGEKTSNVAKELRKDMGGDLDAYVKAIPTGGARILKR